MTNNSSEKLTFREYQNAFFLGESRFEAGSLCGFCSVWENGKEFYAEWLYDHLSAGPSLTASDEKMVEDSLFPHLWNSYLVYVDGEDLYIGLVGEMGNSAATVNFECKTKTYLGVLK